MYSHQEDGTLWWARPDTKTQVTCEYVFDKGTCVPIRVHTVVVSYQHSKKVTLKAKSKKGHSVQVQLEKGNKKFLQLDSKIRADLANQKLEGKIKYALLRKISGYVLVKFDTNTFVVKDTDAAKETTELTVTVIPGASLNIEGKKNGESMWTYKTSRTTTMTGMTLVTDMTLNSNSMVHKFLTKHYPYGAFNTRHNKLQVVVDKNNLNLLALNSRLMPT